MFIGRVVMFISVCPVSVLTKCMKLAGMDANSNLPLFRSLVFHKSNASYTLRDGKNILYVA